MPTELSFAVAGTTVTVTPQKVVVAGWTGRDRAAVDHHIEELAAIGVPRPSTVPVYYRVAAARVTQDDIIEAVGGGSSGEVEPVLVVTDAGLLLTVGSDHTDRDLETTSVALSKAIAEKPIARTAVRLDTIADLDAATLESDISDDGTTFRPYQRGTLAAIRPLAELVKGAEAALGGLPVGTVLFCGTVPAIGGIVPARHFRGSLTPAGGAPLTLSYTVDPLPIVS